MARVGLNDLRAWLEGILRALNMEAENAKIVADVVMRATLRGVGHHDIYDFPSRIRGLMDGSLTVNPAYKPLASFGAMESWDADNGLGELACAFAMRRAVEAARVHGIGLCAVRASNHYMAAAPYVEWASEQGFAAMLLCKGAPTMGAPDRVEKVVGTLPMGYAFPTDRGWPVLFDACMAYASFGALKARMDGGEPVPDYWGFDAQGRPTTDPQALSKGTRLPIGGHKGFGLAVLGEMLTAVLSHGCVIDEPDLVHGQASPTSHTAIAMRTDALMSARSFEARTGEMVARMQARAPGLHVPGQGSYASRQRLLGQGSIDLKEDLLEQLDTLCGRIPAPEVTRQS